MRSGESGEKRKRKGNGWKEKKKGEVLSGSRGCRGRVVLAVRIQLLRPVPGLSGTEGRLGVDTDGLARILLLTPWEECSIIATASDAAPEM